MTQEIKDKLEQAAQKYEIELYGVLSEEPCLEGVHFKAGAQTILENPVEWGFVDVKEHNDYLGRYARAIDKIANLESQLAKYREALEQLKDLHSNHEFTCILIDEALKKEEQ